MSALQSAGPTGPVPGELSTEHGERLLRQIRDFERPSPVVIFTGGDLLMRNDIFHLLGVARDLDLRVAVAPIATPMPDEAHCGAWRTAASVDCPSASTGPEAVHDRIRGVPGTHQAAIATVREAQNAGLAVRINTVERLADVAATLLDEGVHVWEEFFLIATGRALANEYLPHDQWDDACRSLLDATRQGLLVRTVEGPFVRRVLHQSGAEPDADRRLYRPLRERLRSLSGGPVRDRQMARTGTLDGDGIVFVTHDGTITRGGSLPLRLGDVRHNHPVEVYRSHRLPRAIRARAFDGRCGICPLRRAREGSRARTYAATGDPLGSDLACAFEPVWPARSEQSASRP